MDIKLNLIMLMFDAISGWLYKFQFIEDSDLEIHTKLATD